MFDTVQRYAALSVARFFKTANFSYSLGRRVAIAQAVHEDPAPGDPGIATRGVARLILGGPRAHQLVKSGAERAKARETNQVADFGDRQVRGAKQVLGSFDPPLTEILRRSLTVRDGEATQEVVLRHASRGREELQIERLRVVAVHEIEGMPQMRHQLDRYARPRRGPWLQRAYLNGKPNASGRS